MKERSFWILHLISQINCPSCFQYTSKLIYPIFPGGGMVIFFGTSNPNVIICVLDGGKFLITGWDAKCMISLLAVKH